MTNVLVDREYLAELESDHWAGTEEADRWTRDKLILALVGLNVADVVTTTIALHLGAHEGNPLMAPFAGSWLALVLVKVMMLALIVTCLRSQPRARRAMLSAAWMVGVFTMVILNNLLVIAHHA